MTLLFPPIRRPRLREAEVQRLVTDAASLLGWSWLHIRPGMNRRGIWSTAVSGPLGAGFVDLVLVSERRRRLLFVEVKGFGGRLSDDQTRVHAILRAAGLEVHVVGPAEVDAFLEILQAPHELRPASDVIAHALGHEPPARPSTSGRSTQSTNL